MNNMTLRRIQKEYKSLQDDPSLLTNAVVVPDPDNLLEWHFAVYGLDDPYKGGVYHGVVELPNNYPKSPPGIKVFTPSGRFTINYKLCMSISDWHPETWNPSWQVYQVILGLISVMSEDVEFGVGMIMESKETRHKLAKESIEFNLRSSTFKRLFEPYFEKLSIKNEKAIVEEQKDNLIDQLHDKMNKRFENEREYVKKKRELIDYLVPIGVAGVALLGLAYLFVSSKKRG